MIWRRPQLFSLLLLAMTTACASRSEVLRDYRDVASMPGTVRSQKTLLFFLVDGLSVANAQRFLSDGSMPETRNFFLGSAQNFRLGRAVFPSLTHSNISSIVSTRNVDQHPILGNKIRLGNKTINFESPLNRSKLDELLRPTSVFETLSLQHRRSVSFAPYYGGGATARMPLDASMGLAYENGEYAYIDARIIESLSRFLKGTPVPEWPELVFVHLVGIDGYSHMYGPRAVEVKKHARFLDQHLREIFALLSRAEASGREVSALLTSDHGMTEITRQLSIEATIRAAVPGVEILNQARLLTLYFGPEHSMQKRRELLAGISKNPGIEVTALRESPDEVSLFAQGRVFTLRSRQADCGHEGPRQISLSGGPYLCPSQADASTKDFFHPYFATNLDSFFHAPGAPDGLILAAQGVSFGSGPGSHGGATSEELLVPVLSHHFEIDNTEPVLRSFSLLKKLNQRTAP